MIFFGEKQPLFYFARTFVTTVSSMRFYRFSEHLFPCLTIVIDLDLFAVGPTDAWRPGTCLLSWAS